MVTRPLDAGHVRDTTTSHLDRRVDEDAVDPLHRLDRAVRVLAPTGGKCERVGIAARKRSPRGPVGLFVDIARNDDGRTACRSTRHNLVDVPATLIAIEIEVDAAQ